MVSPAAAALFAFDSVANGAEELPAAESLPLGEMYHSAARAIAGASAVAAAAKTAPIWIPRERVVLRMVMSPISPSC